MNPEIKEKWLIALRSGEYKHTRGKLRKSTLIGIEHCCLGVLCEIFMKETGIGRWETPNLSGSFKFVIETGNSSSAYLPLKIQEWAGVSGQTALFDNGIVNSLALVNDESNSFERVIEAIEKYF